MAEELKRYGEAEEAVDFEVIRKAEERLLPCPFCGNSAWIEHIPPHTHGGIASFMPDCEGEHFIQCHGCSCAIAGGSDLEESIAAWNNRIKETSDAVKMLNEETLNVSEPITVKLQSDYDPKTFARICKTGDGDVILNIFGDGEMRVSTSGSVLRGEAKTRVMRAFAEIINTLQEQTGADQSNRNVRR